MNRAARNLYYAANFYGYDIGKHYTVESFFKQNYLRYYLERIQFPFKLEGKVVSYYQVMEKTVSYIEMTQPDFKKGYTLAMYHLHDRHISMSRIMRRGTILLWLVGLAHEIGHAYDEHQKYKHHLLVMEARGFAFGAYMLQQLVAKFGYPQGQVLQKQFAWAYITTWQPLFMANELMGLRDNHNIMKYFLQTHDFSKYSYENILIVYPRFTKGRPTEIPYAGLKFVTEKMLQGKVLQNLKHAPEKCFSWKSLLPNGFIINGKLVLHTRMARNINLILRKLGVKEVTCVSYEVYKSWKKIVQTQQTHANKTFLNTMKGKVTYRLRNNYRKLYRESLPVVPTY